MKYNKKEKKPEFSCILNRITHVVYYDYVKLSISDGR